MYEQWQVSVSKKANESINNEREKEEKEKQQTNSTGCRQFVVLLYLFNTNDH
jgi:hypothetical protein